MKRIIREKLRHRVVVTLKSGEAFAGVLYSADSEAFVLRGTEQLGAGERGSHLPVDGEVLVLRGDVAYLQIP